MSTSLKWREAQAWLAGYSDGLAGNESTRGYWDEYAEHYERGRLNGEQRAEVRAA